MAADSSIKAKRPGTPAFRTHSLRTTASQCWHANITRTVATAKSAVLVTERCGTTGSNQTKTQKGVDKLSPAGRSHLKQRRQEQAQSLRAIPLKVALPRCGAQTDRHNKRKWLAPTGVLSVNGQVHELELRPGKRRRHQLGDPFASPGLQSRRRLARTEFSRCPLAVCGRTHGPARLETNGASSQQIADHIEKSMFSGGLQSFCYPQQPQS